MAFVSGQIWQRAGKAAETASGGKNYPNQEMKIIKKNYLSKSGGKNSPNQEMKIIKLFQFIQIRRC